MLEGTNEVIHPSVRIRMEMEGLGVGDKGNYKPRALKGWKWIGYSGKYRWVGGEAAGARARGKGADCQSGSEGSQEIRADGKIVLMEEELGELEMELLRRSPEAVGYYLKDGAV